MESSIQASNPKMPPYQPFNGCRDACLNLDGTVRPEWFELFESIGRHGQDGVKQWGERAAHISRERGLAYRPASLDEDAKQPWSIDPIPWIISSERWAVLEAGISQRLRLYSALFEDVYGPQRTLKEGMLPMEIILGHPGFLRSLHQLAPSGTGLGMTAFDMVKDSEGRAVVVNDRFDTSKGLGMALENRTIVNKVLPNLFRRCGVRRIGNFYADWFELLANYSANPVDDPLIVILDSPKDDNSEISFIANYCGITRIYPSDLTVRNGHVWIKSLKGLLPVDVIWRAVAGSGLDSLESERPSNGTAGLFEAFRLQNVTIANHPGAAVLQSDGIYPFLPNLCREFLSEDLLLPSANTWWCGDPASLSHVIANMDKMLIKSVCNSHLFKTHYGRLMTAQDRANIEAVIRANPTDFVGQEEIAVGSIPALSPQGLIPKKAVVRTFAFTKQNKEVAILPGGSARLANSKGVVFEAESKDVWVRSQTQENVYDISSVLTISGFRAPDIVASRTAENLYWTGRYSERAALAARFASRVIDCRSRGISAVEGFEREHETFLIESLFELFECQNFAKGMSNDDRFKTVLTDTNCPASISFNLKRFKFATSVTHEQWSPASFQAIGACYDQWMDATSQPFNSFFDLDPAIDRLKLNLAAFLGLNLDSMTRDSAWALLDIGRGIERCNIVCGLLVILLKSDREGEMKTIINESILYLLDSVRTYQSMFYKKPETELTNLLLLSQREYPKSLSYLLDRIVDQLKRLPDPNHQKHPRSIAVSMQARLIDFVVVLFQWQKNNQFDRDEAITFLDEMIASIMSLSNNLTTAYFSHAEKGDE